MAASRWLPVATSRLSLASERSARAKSPAWNQQYPSRNRAQSARLPPPALTRSYQPGGLFAIPRVFGVHAVAPEPLLGLGRRRPPAGVFGEGGLGIVLGDPPSPTPWRAKGGPCSSRGSSAPWRKAAMAASASPSSSWTRPRRIHSCRGGSPRCARRESRMERAESGSEASSAWAAERRTAGRTDEGRVGREPSEDPVHVGNGGVRDQQFGGEPFGFLETDARRRDPPAAGSGGDCGIPSAAFDPGTPGCPAISVESAFFPSG
jgi:hypothetical protein